MTTKNEIKNWFQQGVDTKATHMIIVCDTFDYEDYPVYVKQDEKVSEVLPKYDRSNMQKIMEVYDLSLDMKMQLEESRAYHV